MAKAFFLPNTLRGVPRLAKTDIATFYFFRLTILSFMIFRRQKMKSQIFSLLGFEFAKSRALRAPVPSVPFTSPCSRALRVFYIPCSRALSAFYIPCPPCLLHPVPSVPFTSRALRAFYIPCFRALRAFYIPVMVSSQVMISEFLI